MINIDRKLGIGPLNAPDTVGSGANAAGSPSLPVPPASVRELSQAPITVNDFGIENFVFASIHPWIYSFDLANRADYDMDRKRDMIALPDHRDVAAVDIMEAGTYYCDTETTGVPAIYLYPGERISEYYPNIDDNFDKLVQFVTDFIASPSRANSPYEYRVSVKRDENRVEIYMENAQANMEQAWGKQAQMANSINAGLKIGMPELRIDLNYRNHAEINVWPEAGRKTFADRDQLMKVLEGIAGRENLKFRDETGKGDIQSADDTEYLSIYLSGEQMDTMLVTSLAVSPQHETYGV